MKIDIPIDCGNSPRKLFIKDLNQSFVNGDINFILDHLHPYTQLLLMVGWHHQTGRLLRLEKRLFHSEMSITSKTQ